MGQDKLLHFLQCTLPFWEVQYKGENRVLQYMGEYGDSKDELETNFV